MAYRSKCATYWGIIFLMVVVMIYFFLNVTSKHEYFSETQQRKAKHHFKGKP